jgi:menaquinone-dependent protoporphyrinogen IX oxidase
LLPRGSDHRGRILLVYATTQPHTRVIADAVAARLRSHGFAVEIGDASEGGMPPPQDYDAVILGGPLGSGQQSRLIETYIEQHLEALAEVPTALFTVSRSGTIRDLDPDGFLGPFSRAVDWRPDLAAAFAGGEPFPRAGLIVRFANRLGYQEAPRDDVALRTSWSDVEHFADTIATELAGAAETAERTEPHRDDAA